MRKSPRRRNTKLRETIRDKAGELFAQAGYGNITVEDIANHLGISKASIYYHFASKEEIYYEFNLVAHERARVTIQKIAESDDPPLEKLKLAIENHIDLLSFNLTKPIMMDLHWRFVFPKKLAAPIKRSRKEYDKYLRQIINEGIAKDVFVDLDPKVVGYMISGAINFIPQWYNPKGQFSQSQLKEIIVAYLLKGIVK